MDGSLTPVNDPSPEIIESLVAIVREAELQANLVINFLQANGIAPRIESAGNQKRADPSGPTADFLLSLGAGLRLITWENAGIKDEMGEDLPDARVAISSAAAAFIENRKSAHVEARQLSGKVMKAAHRRLSRAASSQLHKDVVVPCRIDGATVRQLLAEFLFAHRNEKTQ